MFTLITIVGILQDTRLLSKHKIYSLNKEEIKNQNSFQTNCNKKENSKTCHLNKQLILIEFEVSTIFFCSK